MSLDQYLFNVFNVFVEVFVEEIIQLVNLPPNMTTVRWDGVCQQKKAQNLILILYQNKKFPS